MTKLEALEKSLAMWEWLAETGSCDKPEYFDYLKSNNIDYGEIPLFCCYLCEYQLQHDHLYLFTNTLCGRACLVDWVDTEYGHCTDEGSPYKSWVNAPDHWRSYYAYQVVTKIKKAIKELKECDYDESK